MKKELNKKIIEICEEAGTSAAAAKCGEIMDELDRDYDSRIAAGMTELDAYREVMKRIDEIKSLVDSLPDDEPSEDEKKDRAKGLKTLEKLLDKTSTVMWLATVLLYFFISFGSMKWHITWVIFLLSSAAQVLLDMIKDLNTGKKSRKKVIRDGASAILWLLTVVLYFIISFASGKWALTWLIFVVAAIVQKLFR